MLEAARAAKKGATAAEVRRVADRAVENVKIFVTIDCLDYAVRGGRLSKGQGMIAKALNIKPICSLPEKVILRLLLSLSALSVRKTH